MAEDHSATAITTEAQVIESVAFDVTTLKKIQVFIPFISNDFAAGETANRDNHSGDLKSRNQKGI